MQKKAVSLYKIALYRKFMITFEAIDAASPGKSLAAALQAFERKHGVHLTLHDCRGIFYHADGTPFFPGRYLSLIHISEPTRP